MPRSTYYYRSTAAAVGLSDDRLLELINQVQDDMPSYGYRRVTHELRRRGHVLNHKRVARVMKANGLGVKRHRRFVRPTESSHGQPISPNLYRNTIPVQPNVVWVADMTYIRLARGFCYLAAILDACSRKVIGYALSTKIDTSLALAALKAAIDARKPPVGCIHHSDRGSQYASEIYRRALEQAGLRGSMSSAGNPYHNAQAESFMKTIKAEHVYLADYDSFDDVIGQLPQFLEDVYNAKRLHSAIGYLPPNEFEAQHAQQAA